MCLSVCEWAILVDMTTIVACLCEESCLGNETVFLILTDSDQIRAEAEEKVEHPACSYNREQPGDSTPKGEMIPPNSNPAISSSIEFSTTSYIYGFFCANFTLLKGPKTLFMFTNFEPGYHVLYLPLDRFHLHNDWLFSDSCLVGAVNPFSHPTYSNRISRDSTQPEDTEVVSCWNRLLAPKFWKFCEKNKKLREAYFPAV